MGILFYDFYLKDTSGIQDNLGVMGPIVAGAQIIH